MQWPIKQTRNIKLLDATCHQTLHLVNKNTLEKWCLSERHYFCRLYGYKRSTLEYIFCCFLCLGKTLHFFSRDNIEPGMVTFHPAGLTHGPHPKAFDGAQTTSKTFTDEVAVMIDTRHALSVGEAAQAVENSAYVNSWKGALK